MPAFGSDRTTCCAPVARLWLMLLVIVGIAGCGKAGPDLGKPLAVKGKVTMDGAPAASVDVVFSRTEGEIPPESRQFTARTDAGGEFSMPKVFPANYHVSITDPEEAKQQEMAAVETGKYKNYGVSSKLSAKVGDGSTEFTFDLKSK